MKSQTENFLTQEEEQEIVAAIESAEKNTSGEIRVHIEKKLKPSADIFKAAQKKFASLKMYKTQEKNGVLFFIAVENKTFAIYGDKGIHEKVGDDFWQSTRDIMQEHFKQEQFAKGIIAAVLQAGEKLKIFFPYQSDDVNELPNEISKG